MNYKQAAIFLKLANDPELLKEAALFTGVVNEIMASTNLSREETIQLLKEAGFAEFLERAQKFLGGASKKIKKNIIKPLKKNIINPVESFAQKSIIKPVKKVFKKTKKYLLGSGKRTAKKVKDVAKEEGKTVTTVGTTQKVETAPTVGTQKVETAPTVGTTQKVETAPTVGTAPESDFEKNLKSEYENIKNWVVKNPIKTTLGVGGTALGVHMLRRPKQQQPYKTADILEDPKIAGGFWEGVEKTLKETYTNMKPEFESMKNWVVKNPVKTTLGVGGTALGIHMLRRPKPQKTADLINEIRMLLNDPKTAGLFNKETKPATLNEIAAAIKKNLWKIVGATAIPAAYIAGHAHGENKQLNRFLNQQQNMKYGSIKRYL